MSSARLARFFRRHPWLGFATVVFMLIMCVVILVTSSDERALLSGYPLWLIATAGIVLFAWAGLRYVNLLRGKRDR